METCLISAGTVTMSTHTSVLDVHQFKFFIHHASSSNRTKITFAEVEYYLKVSEHTPVISAAIDLGSIDGGAESTKHATMTLNSSCYSTRPSA
ncbi:uncharacterized protein ARMOST_10935 [Armillaria ostoyae]|uniref:Uncharacterized protein n=1 Tax=Armillaria ostoyae TaxID=47428 RepID=A0A284RFQ7_ARMOS|nr:uncharacterized protein ARMOST_10935 [Armillaria ostoyae]